jgi:cytochrome P450
LHDVNRPLEEGVDVVMDTTAFIPFSTALRNCPGKNLGLMELCTVVSYIMQRFDMKVADGYNLNDWEGHLKDYFILSRGGLPVVLTSHVRAL